MDIEKCRKCPHMTITGDKYFCPYPEGICALDDKRPRDPLLQEKGCDLCKNDSGEYQAYYTNNEYSRIVKMIIRDNEMHIDGTDFNGDKFHIITAVRFCPQCGRRLK